MKQQIKLFLTFGLVFCFSQTSLLAQDGSGGWFSNGLVFGIIIVVLGAILVVSENLLKVEAKRAGVDIKNQSKGGFLGWKSIVKPSIPDHIQEGQVHVLGEGFDVKLEGSARKDKIVDRKVTRVALVPPNFRGIRPIPKLFVAEGDQIKAGDPIFYDKENPDIKYVSPVSGEFVELKRGDKRAITALVILVDQDEMSYREIPSINLEESKREDVVKFLMEYGAWPLMIQRPFDIVPEPDVIPKSIFISTFNTAPLAADTNLLVKGREADFAKGLEVLNKLSDRVVLGLDGRNNASPADVFVEAKGVEKHWFKGAHPAGNVGVHIHHVDPIKTGEAVWTVDVQSVITIGALLTQQKYKAERVVAIAGAEVEEPHYVRTFDGANIGELLENQLIHDQVRIVNGDPLSGETKNLDGFLNARSSQITVLEEGDYYEPFGWLVPGKLRPSISRTYPNFLFPDMTYKGDTNTHGEKRAFVVTGQYESLLPMDIYLQQLMKAILVNDFERMEGLGVLELSEEDVALAEFACVSKQPLQEILREGLDYVKSQM